MSSAHEALLGKSPVRPLAWETALKEKKIISRNLRGSYYQSIKRLVNFPLIAKSKLKFAHEALFGVGAGCFDELLAGIAFMKPLLYRGFLHCTAKPNFFLSTQIFICPNQRSEIKNQTTIRAANVLSGGTNCKNWEFNPARNTFGSKV